MSLTVGTFETGKALSLDSAEIALEKLAFEYNGERLFRAADPGYQRNFTRDSLISALLSDDHEAMKAQVRYSALFQGTKANPATGEEPGKIHHEKHHDMPDIIHNGKSTAYNACDTTALFLECIARLCRQGEYGILTELQPNIDAAIDYITPHVREGLFWEDPTLSGADRFGLKVTYWKDSVLNDPDRTEPVYPVAYTQPHFQNAEALMSIAELRQDDALRSLALEMYEAGINRLWADDHFVTAIDQVGAIDPVSSDSLMTIGHIPTGVLPEGYAEAIQQYMGVLETPAGYLSGIQAGSDDDVYHTRYVWTHEQGLLHQAAVCHGLSRSAAVTERILGYIDADNGTFPELIDPLEGYKPAGSNMLQLWCVAMYKYMTHATARTIAS